MKPKEYEVIYKFTVTPTAPFPSALNLNAEPIGGLIRCKDCKHWQCDDNETYCDELGIFGTDMSSYCSFAERKEE